MLKLRLVQLPMAIIGLAALMPVGCESVPDQDPYAAIQTGFCEQVEEAEDECIKPLDMTVDVHE